MKLRGRIRDKLLKTYKKFPPILTEFKIAFFARKKIQDFSPAKALQVLMNLRINGQFEIY